MQFMLIFKEIPAEYGRHDDPAAQPAYYGAWGGRERRGAAGVVTAERGGLRSRGELCC